MKPLLNVLHGQALSPPPVWLMRQAGRYLPEYRALRATADGFMHAVLTPSMAAEITLQPLRRYAELDAAILFSDILVIPYALGLDVRFGAGEGPTMQSLDKEDVPLSYDPAKLAPIYETLRLVKQGLSDNKTLIGFAGSAWTVACYMISGRHDKQDFIEAKQWAFAQPERLDALLAQIVDATVHYLIEQVKAGAEVLQLFDSWAGLLAGHGDEFARFIIEPTKTIVARVKQSCPHIPIIGFPRMAGQQIVRYATETGIQGLGLDWSVDLEAIVDRLPRNLALQGNLDPVVLLTGGPVLEHKTQQILRLMRGRPFIFNLGHGVMPSIPLEHVGQLLACVKKG